MAGKLPKNPEQFHRIDGARIAIISSQWHEQFVTRMVKRCEAELIRLGVQSCEKHLLPGSLELPYAARMLFEKRDYLDAIVAFGIVLKGATTHDSSVLQQVVHGFSLVSDRYQKPIVNEVFGVTDLSDAEKRSGDDNSTKGVEAAFALSELIAWQRGL